MLLNTLIVGDTFWGIRPSDFLDYLNITGRNINKVPVDMNFLTNIIINLLTVPFLLYLISAFQVDGLQFGNHLKLIWIYPFLLTIFLTVVLFASGHGVTDRFFFPAVPVLCIFGSQVLQFCDFKTRGDKIRLGVYSIIGLVVSVAILLMSQSIVSITKYTMESLTHNVIQTIFLSIFLVSLVWNQPLLIRKMALPIICLIVLLFQPIFLNFHSIVIDQPTNRKLSQLLYPFSVFSNKINYSPTMKLYISSSIYKENQMLSLQNDELRSMFNVYFRENANLGNFINPIIYDKSKGELSYLDPMDSLPEINYDYAIITANDWNRIRQDFKLFSLISSNYEFTLDDQGSIGLLTKKVK
jgi:hypothetical protein